MYKRKTYDVWILEGNYGNGWEELFECESGKEAREQLDCYRKNEPMHPHRIKKVRKYFN